MRRLVALAATLLGVAIPVSSAAEPPTGSYSIDVGGDQSILLPSDLSESSCESSEGVTICIGGVLATAGSGVVTGSALAEVTGSTTGTLEATIAGRTAGTTANTKLTLALQMTGALTQGDLTLDVEAKGKVACAEGAMLVGLRCSGRLKLCAYDGGKKVGCGTDRLDFEVEDEGGPWQLRLDLETDVAGHVSGTGEVELATGQILPYAVDGKYAAKRDTATIRLTGTGDASGSKLKLSKLSLAGGFATGGRMVFKIAGQKGELELVGPIAALPSSGHGRCIPGGFCDGSSDTVWIFPDERASDPYANLGTDTVFFGNLGSMSRPLGGSR